MEDRLKTHKTFWDGFVKNDRNREGFFELHQRQKAMFATQADRLDHFETSATININSLTRLRCFITLTDLFLGTFVHSAQSRARAAYLSGTRHWHQQYMIDVADVSVTLKGRTVHIIIKPADQFYFEYATSGYPVLTDTVTQGGVDYTSYKGCMVGVNVALRNGALVTSPHILNNKRDTNGAHLSLVERGYQIQLIHEPVAYPQSTFKYGRVRALKTVYEAYAPPHAWSGVLLRTTDIPLSTFSVPQSMGPNSTYTSRDIGYDVPYMDGDKSDPVRIAYIKDTADWPRANGRQLVEDDDFGSREFAIYVDAFNQFAVFPTAGITALNPADPYAQNVPEFLVRRLEPELPAWCYVPSTKAKDYWASNPNTLEWAVDEPETEWKFNHLGTKAVAILFEREAYSFDSTYWAVDPSATQEFDATDFAALSSWMGVFSNYTESFAPYTYNPTRYFIAPGVIEVEIEIELTGPNLEDYVAKLKVRTVRQASVDEDKSRWAMAVGYVWYDIPKNKHLGRNVKAGELVALDVEYWVHPMGTNGDATERQIIYSIRSLEKVDELFSLVGMPLLALDLTTLSMVGRLDIYTQEYRFSGGANVGYNIRHSGALIIHNGVGKEILYPETMSPDLKPQFEQYLNTSGRDVLKALDVASGGQWRYVPVTTPYDGWTSSFTDYRDWWARQDWYWYDEWYAFIDPDLDGGGKVRFKTGTHSFPADGDDTETWLNALGGDFRPLFFCDSPRWGWHQYTNLMAGFMLLSSQTTFYTHPNGTYVFWCDGWVYDKNGMPWDFTNGIGPGASGNIAMSPLYTYMKNTLSAYDPTKIEHVIFDRVHFEVRSGGKALATKNTTLRELYNKAVEIGKAAETLEDPDNFKPIELKDMRATFTKEIGDDVDAEHQFLDLKVTWHGRDYWSRESAYSYFYGSTAYPPLYGTAGNFNNLNLYANWRSHSFNTAGSGSLVPGTTEGRLPSQWHVRFANALIIMEK